MKIKKNIINRSIEIARIATDARALRTEDDPVAAKNARLYLKERLGRLRGLPQKMGQILSMAGDEAVAEDFRDLTDSFEAFPSDLMVKELEKSWGCPISKVLKDFDVQGHPASLGQVHKGVLKDGRKVAIKIRYPGIKEAVMNDLNFLGWLSLPVGNLNRGFNIKEYQRIILEDLMKELDYRQEAALQDQYTKHSKHLSFLIVPQVYHELVKENVLVSSWEEGSTIEEVVQNWSNEHKRSLSNKILEHFVEMFFCQKMVHADPHPGNYRFVISPEGVKIILYDFGCVYTAHGDESLILLKIIKGCMDYSNDDPYALYLDLGFNPDYLSPIQDKIPALTKVFFEPFMLDYPFDLSTAFRKERVEDILGKHHLNFRLAGPAGLIFLMRAFGGLEYYVRKLGVDIMWKPAIARVIESNQTALSNYKSPNVSQIQGTRFSDLAQNLYVEVKKDGEVKAELIFPIASVDDLESIMDMDIIEKIKAKGISLQEMTKKARANGYRPLDLFILDDYHSNLRVWLA